MKCEMFLVASAWIAVSTTAFQISCPVVGYNTVINRKSLVFAVFPQAKAAVLVSFDFLFWATRFSVETEVVA